MVRLKEVISSLGTNLRFFHVTYHATDGPKDTYCMVTCDLSYWKTYVHHTRTQWMGKNGGL